MKHFWFWSWWNTVRLLICARQNQSLSWQSVATFIQEFVKCHSDHVRKVNCKIQDLSWESMWNWTWLSYSYIRSSRWAKWYLLTECVCPVLDFVRKYIITEHCVLESHATFNLFSDSLLILLQKIQPEYHQLETPFLFIM